MALRREAIVSSDPEILGGTPVFVGTRVPVKAFIDYLEGGHTIDEFLDDFPTVSREQAMAALEVARAALSGSLTPTQRLELVEELWDSLSPEDIPLTNAQAQELDRREVLHRADPQRGRPWRDVLDDIERRRG